MEHCIFSGAGSMTLSLPTFRSADARDAVAIAQFGERLFRETFAPQHRAADVDAYCRDAFAVERVRAELSDPERQTFVAEHAGTIIGYVQLHPTPAPDCVPVANAFELLRFYVDGAWHGRGIAPALLSRVVAAAERHGVPALYLLVWEGNQRAIAFYEKHGFRRVGTLPFIMDSPQPLDFVMMRELASVSARESCG
jgi:ribosomal protein S18 acetylase RimI-like enzyme